MQRSLAAAAAWSALVAGAAALARHELAPRAGHELAPAADVELATAAGIDLGPAAEARAAELELGEEPPWGRVTPQHSHSVLKGLVAEDGVDELKRAELLDGQLDPAALVIEDAAPQPRAELRLPAPPGQVGVCAGTAVYDGPSMGWEDCRTRCLGHEHCRFWSFWPDSAQQRCKLTLDCSRRERDGHRSVSAYRRALDAAGEEESRQQAAWDNGETPLDPEPQEAAPQPQEAATPRAAPVADQMTCSPQGSARKFAVSPQSGWHNLGKARSYASCANTSLSMGYGNVVWNAGSSAKGRCYGFSSDMPDVLERNCEETYCWLFGTASPACKDQSLMAGTADAEDDKLFGAGPQAATESTKVKDPVDHDIEEMMESVQTQTASPEPQERRRARSPREPCRRSGTSSTSGEGPSAEGLAAPTAIGGSSETARSPRPAASPPPPASSSPSARASPLSGEGGSGSSLRAPRGEDGARICGGLCFSQPSCAGCPFWTERCGPHFSSSPGPPPPLPPASCLLLHLPPASSLSSLLPPFSPQSCMRGLATFVRGRDEKCN
ncbi:unnamed protein product [Prorocentrum cordatum]|uniref:Apple domain-containing protein n=1 Tax=Prorocentrum cordatum TaxID=2364126 RepID=A0ABN9PJQ2_9DINO|nr:unnamed protein product [Polarella glacialis]